MLVCSGNINKQAVIYKYKIYIILYYIIIVIIINKKKIKFKNLDAASKKSFYILKAGKNIEGNGNINIGYENDK